MKEFSATGDYGFVSGRVSANFIQAAIESGVSESSLRETHLWKSFDSCRDLKSLCYWNDFIRLLDCAYAEVGTIDGLRDIGRQMVRVISKTTYLRWVRRVVSIQTGMKLIGNTSYNYPNMKPSCDVFSDRAEMHVKMLHVDDVYSRNFFYFGEGFIEMMPTLLGFEPMHSIEYHVDLDDPSFTGEEVRYTMFFPKRKSVWAEIKQWYWSMRARAAQKDMLQEHGEQILQIEADNKKERTLLYGVIEKVNDAVLIIRDEQVFFSNRAFSSMVANRKHEKWADYFEGTSEIVGLIQSDKLEAEPARAKLKRQGMPSIEVAVSVVSAVDHANARETVLKISDYFLPSDPSEILLEGRKMERASLARDMHDSLGQLLTATSFQLTSLQHSEKEGERAKKIGKISQMVREITMYSRKFTRQLDQLIAECHTIPEAIEVVVDEFSVISGITVKNRISKDFTVNHPDAIEYLSYVMQEALNNAFRHGRANEVLLRSIVEPGRVALVIEDNGCGMTENPSQTGLGLCSMNYRVTNIGGDFKVSSNEGLGVKIVCEFNTLKEVTE